ncbi:MAG: alpha/beta hydrolase [Proteobacteria bacterium]|nr:alpha/beta hydrolase [Pseudomonadota bacterium]
MIQFAQEIRDHEWLGYYDSFSYFSPEKIRHGCHPRIMEHAESPEKAIVLVHGLSDSPYFMTAIGDHFFKGLGYNVYMPLLHGHGLKDPKGMEGVKLEEWKANVGFAIESAAAKSEQISVGGLSTGGTLSFYMAANNPKINGALYLFSAALDLAGGPCGFLGELKERLLRTFLADVLDRNKPLVNW